MKSLTDRLSGLHIRLHNSALRRSHCPKIDPATGLRVSQLYFGHLPVEMILIIASYLPYHSAVALALCNKGLTLMLDKPYIKPLNPPKADPKDIAGAKDVAEAKNLADPNDTDYIKARAADIEDIEKALSLKIINRNSLNTFVCYRCLRIHRMLKEPEQNLTLETRANRVKSGCRVRQSDSKLSYLEMYSLKHLEVATKLYQHGHQRDAHKYLRLVSIPEPTRTLLAINIQELGFWEAYFLNDKIYARTQYWLELTADHLARLANKRLFITPCEHMNMMKNDENDLSREVSRIFHDIRRGIRSWDRKVETILSCRKCRNEVAVGISSRNLSRYLVITKWQYTGTSAPDTRKPQVEPDLYLRKSLLALAYVPVANTLPCFESIRNVFEEFTSHPLGTMFTHDKAWKMETEEPSSSSWLLMPPH